jgi:hypothetical protein
VSIERKHVSLTKMKTLFVVSGTSFTTGAEDNVKRIILFHTMYVRPYLNDYEVKVFLIQLKSS